MARFQPIPVAHYITHCLPPEGTIHPYLHFGALNAPLEGNPEVEAGKAWLEALEFDERGGKVVREVGGEDSLGSMLRRMKEELKGQADAEVLESSAANFSSSGASRLPPIPFSTPPPQAPNQPYAPSTESLERPQRLEKPAHAAGTPPSSLPVMLHLLAGTLADGLDGAIRRVGEGAKVGEGVELGELEGGVSAGMVRGRVVHAAEESQEREAKLYEAWVHNGVLWMTRRAGGSDDEGLEVEKAGVKLRLGSEGAGEGQGVEVIEWDFFDDVEMMLAVKIVGKEGESTLARAWGSAIADNPFSSHATAPSYALLALHLSAFTFSTSVRLRPPCRRSRAADPPFFSQITPTPSPHLIPSRTHTFDPHFPPQGLALNGRAGRRVACVLAGEGRMLEVLDAEMEEEDEEEGEADVTMEG